jgi:hypothetical protein
VSEDAGLVVEGRRFWRMLVSQLRAGNLFRDMERRVTRTVARVTTYTRVEFDPMPGQPDHLDFPLHSPQARQWASKGIPMVGVGGASEDELERLEQSWQARDDAIAEGRRPPY